MTNSIQYRMLEIISNSLKNIQDSLNNREENLKIQTAEINFFVDFFFEDCDKSEFF